MSHQHLHMGSPQEGIPMQQFNPAFQYSSLERQQNLPPEGTCYEFAEYKYPDSPSYMKPETPLNVEGPHVLHRRHTTGSGHRDHGSDHVETVDDIAMENLLRRLPSRQLDTAASNAAKTLHRRHTHTKSIHRGLQNDLQQSSDFMDGMSEGSFDAEDEEMMEEAIRSIPTTMAARRIMIKNLSSRKRKPPGFVKRTKYSIGMGWKHFKDNLAELKYTMQLWHSHLKRIEGNFGTDVLSYFIFLKWLLLINIPTLLLTLGFIVVPQILFRWLQQDPAGYVSNKAFTGLELLTGAGWFSPTELYYGFYTNKTIQISGDKSYEMQMAYLFTCGGYYLLTILILGQSILQSYRKYYIEAGDFQSVHIVFKVLGSWNFGLTSAEAVKLKHKSVYYEIKEYLAGTFKKKHSKTIGDHCKLFWLRVLTNFIVLALIGGAGWLVYYLSQQQLDLTTVATNETETGVVGVSQDASKSPLLLLVLPLCIGGIHLILPFVFSFIEGFERYENPKNELYMHLIRSMVLRVGVLTVLVIYWYDKMANRPEIQCWETFMGQELYRLVIVDFIFTLFSTFFSEFVKRLLAGRIHRLQHPTFNIGRNTLELIYSQALCWLGTFFAPLLSLVVIIKMIFIFYVKMISVLQNCKPSERRWRATRSHTIFLGFLFLFFLLTSAAVGCGIILIKPSSGCGPYQGKDVMYSVVPELVDSWKGRYSWLTSVIRFVSSPGFITSILVALGMAVFLVRTIMIGRKETVHRLKQQLVLEGKDKTFLLNLLNQVSQRHSTTSLLAKNRPLTQQMHVSEDATSPGRRLFVRKIAESSVASR